MEFALHLQCLLRANVKQLHRLFGYYKAGFNSHKIFREIFVRKSGDIKLNMINTMEMSFYDLRRFSFRHTQYLFEQIANIGA
jgi:hypothetical protein